MKNEVMKNRSISFLTSVYIVLITFGLPAIVDNGFYNITLTKSKYYHTVSIIFIVACVICLLFRNKKPVMPKLSKPGALDVSVFMYLIAVVLSSFLSQFDDVWLGMESRYQGAVTVILYVSAYFILSRHYENTDWFLVGTVAALVFVSAIGVLNCFGFDPLGIYDSMTKLNKRLYISTIGNVNFYSSFICLMLPFTICGFSSVRTKISKIIYTIAVIVGSLGAMVTASESFVVGFVVIMVIIPFFLFHDAYQIKRFLTAVIIMTLFAYAYSVVHSISPINYVKISELLQIFVHPIVAGAIIVTCLAGLLFLNKKPEKIYLLKKIYCLCIVMAMLFAIGLFIIANVHSLGALDEYLKINADWGHSRGAIWKQCFEIYNNFSFKEKLFGTGPETLLRFSKALDGTSDIKLDQAHNEYLQYLLTVGWFGLLSYLMIVFSVCYTVLKWLKNNTLAIGLLAGLLCFWVQAFVNIAQPFTTPLMYIFISVVGALYYKEKHKNQERGKGDGI